MDIWKMRGTQVTVFIVSLLKWISTVSGVNITTSVNEENNPDKDDEKPFPAWLIGVIILSIVVVLGVIGTIAQRLIRRRAAAHEEYRMNS